MLQVLHFRDGRVLHLSVSMRFCQFRKLQTAIKLQSVGKKRVYRALNKFRFLLYPLVNF